MGTDPVTFPPIDVELESFGVDDKNNLWARLRFGDGSEWDLEWAPDSSGAREVYDFFSRLASESIARVGGRGIVINGLTSIQEDDE